MIDQDKFNWIKKEVQNGIARKDILRSTIEGLEQDILRLQARETAIEKARIVLQIASQRLQSKIEYHISHMVTLALSGVYSEGIEFIAKFTPRRNSTECDFFFKVGDGEEQDVMDCFGGGVLDVASFALKVLMLSLKKNLRRILILDESFKHVSPDLQHKVSEMIKMINEKTKIQIIMVSHAEDINDCADKTFIVEKIGKISQVREEI